MSEKKRRWSVVRTIVEKYEVEGNYASLGEVRAAIQDPYEITVLTESIQEIDPYAPTPVSTAHIPQDCEKPK
jgi:hypothetical protein